jgi:hypothetical protein
MSWCRVHSGTCGQILLPVWRFLSEICGLISARRPLWREDGSAVCSAVTHWSASRRAPNHTLVSHLRLPEPRGPGSRIYIPQEHGGPVIPPGTGFPFRRPLRLTGLRWRYCNPPPQGNNPDLCWTEWVLSHFCPQYFASSARYYSTNALHSSVFGGRCDRPNWDPESRGESVAALQKQKISQANEDLMGPCLGAWTGQYNNFFCCCCCCGLFYDTLSCWTAQRRIVR